MRRIHRLAAGAAATVLSVGLVAAPGPGAAADQLSLPRPRIVPVHKVDGVSPAQLLAGVFVHSYTTAGTTPCYNLGATGKVLVINSDQPCTTRRGSAVLIGYSTSCDSVSDPPYFAVGAAAQRRCAVQLDRGNVVDLRASVDGGPMVPGLSARTETVTRQVHVTIVPGNEFGEPPGPATFVAHGWESLIEGLAVGPHSWSGSVTFADGFTFSVTKSFTVLP